MKPLQNSRNYPIWFCVQFAIIGGLKNHAPLQSVYVRRSTKLLADACVRAKFQAQGQRVIVTATDQVRDLEVIQGTFPIIP